MKEIAVLIEEIMAHSYAQAKLGPDLWNVLKEYNLAIDDATQQGKVDLTDADFDRIKNQIPRSAEAITGYEAAMQEYHLLHKKTGKHL